VPLQEPEPALQLRFGESGSEATERVVRVIAATTKAAQLASEYLGLERRRLMEALCGVFGCRVELNLS
jgi:hypothetical protein